MHGKLTHIAAAFLLLAACGTTASAQFKPLVAKVPPNANTVIVINVDSILNSPLGQREGLRAEAERMYEAGLLYFPPETTRFVLGSELDVARMTPIWEVAIVETDTLPRLEDIASEFGGDLDRIAGQQTVELPTGLYLVPFSDKSIGALVPGNSQAVGRWIMDLMGRTSPAISPYLQEAVGFADEVGTQVIMAIDLRHIAPADDIREKLDSMESLEGSDIDKDALANALSTIQGVTLGVIFSDTRYGAIKVDFEEDVSMLGDRAKPLLLEVLGNQGAMIDVFEQWTATVEGNQVTIEGMMDTSAMQRLLSLVVPPPELAHLRAQQDQPPSPAEATQTYFNSVTQLLDDVIDRRRDARTIGQIGTWYQQYARRIDRLPMLNVDPRMLDYGTFVSMQLRGAHGSITESAARSRVGQVDAAASGGYGIPYTYDYGGYRNYGWGGGGRGWHASGSGTYIPGFNAYLAEQQSRRTQVRTRERVTGMNQANESLQQIELATQQIRREMTEKYQIEF